MGRTKKAFLAVLCACGMVSAAAADNLLSADFTSAEGYYNGTLAGQQDWRAMPLTGSYAFDVDNTNGVADTAPFADEFDTGGVSTNGHYLYILNSFGGNAVDDEWTGTLDFTLSTTPYAGTNIALLSGAQEVFEIGLTSAVTNRLDPADDDDIDIHFRQKLDTLDVTLSKAGRYRTLAQFSNAEMGWDPANPDTPDFQTDKLRLTWTIRKTRVAGTYSAVAVLSNLVTGAVSEFDPQLYAPEENVNYVAKPYAYVTSGLSLAMGHDPDADEDGTASLINVAIDSVNVDLTSGNPPTLLAPVLSASSSDGVVDLRWSASIEATSYEVKRSMTSGSGYSVIATVATNIYSDTGVSNDSLYYYVVTAKAADAADVDSNEALGEPQAAATGTVLDTSFLATEGYANANLSGQDRWLTPSENGAPAFQATDVAGSGYADSEPYVADFDTELGNNIYYNRLMSNNVGDEWTSSITFQLKTSPADGQVIEKTIEIFDETGTNSLGFVTTNYTVAANAANELFKIGLTADPQTGLEFKDEGDIFVVVRSQIGGRLDFQLDSSSNKERMFAQLNNLDAGWDPNWDADTASGPDFQTDPITMNFTLRKATSPTNTYTLWGEVVCNGITNSSGIVHEYDGSVDAYAAGVVYLSMGIDEEANERKAVVATNGLAVDDGFEGAPVTVKIDSMSLDKADDQPPKQMVPGNLSADVADGSVILEWDHSVEASAYTVRRYSDISGGSSIVLASTTNLTYTDTGLDNGTTYFYTVAADYGTYGEAETDRLPVRPLGKTTVMQWGPSTEIVDGNANWDVESATVGSIENNVGSHDGAMWVAGSGGHYTVTALSPPLYGVVQKGDGVWAQRQVRNDTPDLIRLRTKTGTLTGNGFYSALVWVDSDDFVGGASFDATAGGYSIEASNTGWVNDASGYDGTLRTAIRNGTQWYVSETVHANNADPAVVIQDISTEKWTPVTLADLDSASLMTVSGAVYSVVDNLTDVNAVGFFCDRLRSVYMTSWKVAHGEQATPLQLWTDSFGIYNADAAADADPDGDGALNVYEWGLGGNPVDPASIGFAPKYAGMDATRSNLVYVYPRLKAEPRPVYTPMELGDLLYDRPWKDRSATYTVTVGGDWPGSAGKFEAVTNVVPTDLDAKFISLNIKE